MRSEGGEVRACRLKDGLDVECIEDSEWRGEEGSLKVMINSTERTAKYRLMNYPATFVKRAEEMMKEKRIIPRQISVRVIYHETENRHCDARKTNKLYR